MTLSEQLDRLERICAAIRAIYSAVTDEQYQAALARLAEALQRP